MWFSVTGNFFQAMVLIFNPGNHFFIQNSNSIGIALCCNSVPNQHIATTFWTCHDSTAAIPCDCWWNGSLIESAYNQMSEMQTAGTSVNQDICLHTGFCISALISFTVFCCRIWSWSPIPCEKHGPRDSVDKKRCRIPRFLSLPRPEGHVFPMA